MEKRVEGGEGEGEQEEGQETSCEVLPGEESEVYMHIYIIIYMYIYKKFETIRDHSKPSLQSGRKLLLLEDEQTCQQ